MGLNRFVVMLFLFSVGTHLQVIPNESAQTVIHPFTICIIGPKNILADTIQHHGGMTSQTSSLSRR